MALFVIAQAVLLYRFGDPIVLHVFRDVTLPQLNAALLYEMSKLMKEEAVERVCLKMTLFAACT